MGEQQVALPLADTRWRDGELVMRELTNQEVDRMEEADLGDFEAVLPARELELTVY